MNAMSSPRLVRTGLAVLCLAVAIVADSDFKSFGSTPDPNVYAVTHSGRLLSPGSEVTPQEPLTVYGRGFSPGARVEVVDPTRRTIAYVDADRHGVAHAAFVVPRALISDRLPMLVLVGRISPRQKSGSPISPPAASSGQRRDGQDFEVTVPLRREFDYRLSDGNNVDSATTIGDGGFGGLASTGFDLVALIVVGVGLLLLGAAAQLNHRRRR